MAALALSKAADVNNGGMAGLAGLVFGLMVGGPLLAFLASLRRASPYWLMAPLWLYAPVALRQSRPTVD